MAATREILIIGAGIAGASLAAAIGARARVTLIEGESQPGYHATGRSAAFWEETYGGPAVQPLTTASHDALGPYLKPRGAIHIADAEGESALDALAAAFAGTGTTLVPLDRAALERAVPGLASRYRRGLAEPSCADIDVGAFHAACLAAARRAGIAIHTDARVEAMERAGERWRVSTKAGTFAADIVVNAAGAWASAVAALAGARPIAITPYRRTVIQLACDPAPAADLPLVMDALGRFYFKPEGQGRLWLSPHDETEVVPHDVAPEELDVAIALDRFEQAVDWRIARVEHRWAGLRSFAPDRAPIYGFDDRAPGFFWCAGQGGFGIQTAPAAAAMAAALLLDAPLPESLGAIDPSRYAPSRFATA
jgi:D-arginine dehydrogenase